MVKLSLNLEPGFYRLTQGFVLTMHFDSEGRCVVTHLAFANELVRVDGARTLEGFGGAKLAHADPTLEEIATYHEAASAQKDLRLYWRTLDAYEALEALLGYLAIRLNPGAYIGDLISLPLTQTDLGFVLSYSRETVSQAYGHLREKYPLRRNQLSWRVQPKDIQGHRETGTALCKGVSPSPVLPVAFGARP